MATQLYIDWQGDFATNTYTLVNPPEIPNSHEVERGGSGISTDTVSEYGDMRMLVRPETAYQQAELDVPAGAQLNHLGASMLLFFDPMALGNTGELVRGVNTDDIGDGLFRIWRDSNGDLVIFLEWNAFNSRIDFTLPWPEGAVWIWVKFNPTEVEPEDRGGIKVWEYGASIPETFTASASTGPAATDEIYGSIHSIILFRADSSEAAVALGPLVIDDDPDADLSIYVTGGSGEPVPDITETTPLKAGQPLTITGTNFSASGNTVILSPTTDHEHADAEEQTIDSEGVSQIVTEGIVLPDGAGPTDTLYLFVIDDDDNVSDPFEVTVSNPAIAFSGIRNSAGTLHTGTVDIKVWTDDPTQNDAAALLDSDDLELTAGDGLFASDDIGMVEDPVWVVLRYVDEGKLNTLVAAATVTDHQPE